MSSHKQKIAFFVVDKRHFDYYGNVLLELNRQKIPFELVINDMLSDVKVGVKESYDDEMVEVAKTTGFEFTTLSNAIASKVTYEVVVSTFTFKFKYRKTQATFGEYLVRSGYRVLQKVLRLTRSSLLSSSLESWLSDFEASKLHLPETILGKKVVQFPKGMDIHLAKFPDKQTKPFIHYYLCHGRFDSNIIAKKTTTPFAIIGYPRYDGLSDPELAKAKGLRAEFGIESDRKIITWLPTYVPRQGNPDFNIDHWAPFVAKLVEKYAVIVRPHPKRVEQDRELLFNKLSAFGFHVDLVAERDMSEMYAGSEFTICDYGGVVFSAVYTDKNLLLINHPVHEESSNWKENINVYKIRDSLHSIRFDEAEQDPEILLKEVQNEQRWIEQKVIRENIRDEYFGGVMSGEGSKAAVNVLKDILG
jgi:hypothetical protein